MPGVRVRAVGDLRAEEGPVTAQTAQGVRVYVIASPAVRKSAAWPKLWPALRARARNAELIMFRDLFPGGSPDYAENWEQRAATLGGAVVVPDRRQGMLWLGRRAVSEAQQLADLGKPVLLFGPDGLVPWPGVRLAWPDRHPPWLAVQVAS
jgi:hypothetical protein